MTRWTHKEKASYASQCGKSYGKTNLINCSYFFNFYVQNYGSNFCQLIYPACEFYCSLSKLKQYERHFISVISTDNGTFHRVEQLLSMILNECGLEWFKDKAWEWIQIFGKIMALYVPGLIIVHCSWVYSYLTTYLYINAKVEKYWTMMIEFLSNWMSNIIRERYHKMNQKYCIFLWRNKSTSSPLFWVCRTNEWMFRNFL